MFFWNTVQTQILIHVRALTHTNTRTHIIPLWAPPKDWADFNFKIHEVGHQERLAIDRDIASHWKNN
jgi:hypothetical protein